MQAATKALIALIAGGSAFSPFLGGGPYWEIAPERTAFPYMVIGQVGGRQIQYGFSGGSYIEPLTIQIDLYDTSLANVEANADTVTKNLDFASLTISGELCRNIMRLEAPRVIAEGMSSAGSRVYHAVIQYRLNVQRTVGT